MRVIQTRGSTCKRSIAATGGLWRLNILRMDHIPESEWMDGSPAKVANGIYSVRCIGRNGARVRRKVSYRTTRPRLVTGEFCEKAVWSGSTALLLLCK